MEQTPNIKEIANELIEKVRESTSKTDKEKATISAIEFKDLTNDKIQQVYELIKKEFLDEFEVKLKGKKIVIC